MARAILKLAHHPDPSYGCLEYCFSTRCMNVGSWNSGNMRLKLSKKSLQRDSASCFGGSDMYVRRANMSLKISGLQYTHFVSSAAAFDIMSWKELSPVFSLIHDTPLGENIENPDDEPDTMSIVIT